MLIVLFYIDFSFPAYHRSQAFRKFDNELYLSWYILINDSANTIDHEIYAQINKKEWVGVVRILLSTAKGFN